MKLEVKQKLQILKLIDKGVKYETIGRQYNVSKGAISKIKNNKASIEEYAKLGNLKRKYIIVRGDNSTELDRRVFQWHCTARSKNIQVSGDMLKTAAVLAAESLIASLP